MKLLRMTLIISVTLTRNGTAWVSEALSPSDVFPPPLPVGRLRTWTALQGCHNWELLLEPYRSHLATTVLA